MGGKAFGNNPQAIEVLAALGKKMQEHGLIGSKGTRTSATPAEAQAEINKIMADPESRKIFADKHHPQRQALMQRWDLLHQQLAAADNPA